VVLDETQLTSDVKAVPPSQSNDGNENTREQALDKLPDILRDVEGYPTRDDAVLGN